MEEPQTSSSRPSSTSSGQTLHSAFPGAQRGSSLNRITGTHHWQSERIGINWVHNKITLWYQRALMRMTWATSITFDKCLVAFMYCEDFKPTSFIKLLKKQKASTHDLFFTIKNYFALKMYTKTHLTVLNIPFACVCPLPGLQSCVQTCPVCGSYWETPAPQSALWPPTGPALWCQDPWPGYNPQTKATFSTKDTPSEWGRGEAPTPASLYCSDRSHVI